MTLYNYFDKSLFSELKQKAINSERKRAHMNLHTSYDEAIQKTVIALAKGTYIPPHFHRHGHQKELFTLLEGSVKVVFFNEDGSIADILTLCNEGMVEVLPFSIHTVVCLSDTALAMEVKSGPFIADDCKEVLDWSIAEESQDKHRYLAWLESALVNEKYC